MYTFIHVVTSTSQQHPSQRIPILTQQQPTKEDVLFRLCNELILKVVVAHPRHEGRFVVGDVPTLAVRGAHSDILSAETFARMKREKPDLEQLEVGNRGHTPLLDEPECLEAIDGFLSRLAFGARGNA